MAVTVKIDPIRKDVEFFIANLRGPAAGLAFREYANQTLEEAKQINKSVLGRVPPFQVFVNGSKTGGSIPAALKISDTILVEFEFVTEALVWISQQLEKFSPVKSGRYKRNHIVLADGVEIEVSAQIPLAEEYVFTNIVPYARKIERGASSEAPNGVYQAVAALARGRFGNLARITFSYRTVISGAIIGGRIGDRSERRNPAIVVRLRGA